MTENKSSILKPLLDLGWNPHAIAREIGVSPNEVYMWQKGIWKPNPKNAQKLAELWEKGRRA